MRRIIVFCLCALFILLLGLFLSTEEFSFAQSDSHKPVVYKVYISVMSELIELPEDANVEDLGFCYEISSNSEILTYKTYKTLGYTTVFACSKTDIYRILYQKNIKINQTYNIENIIVFEGFIRTNTGDSDSVQIAYNNGILSIGSPLIIGSY